MSFAFDTGAPPRRYSVAFAPVTGEFNVALNNPETNARMARQAEAAFLRAETMQDLVKAAERHNAVIDAFYLAGMTLEAEELHGVFASRARQLENDAAFEAAQKSAAADRERTLQRNPTNQTVKGKNMSFDFDTGGNAGPFVGWSAKGTEDGTIPAQSFYLREDAGKTNITDVFKKGVVMDIHTLETGWQQSGGMPGVAPVWKMGESLSQLPPKPGDDWKKGFKVRMALSASQAASWEQAGAGVWGALCKVMPQIQSGPTGDRNQLPVIAITGVEKVTFKVGSTVEPVLSVVKWVKRPDLLDGGGGFDQGENDQPAAQPQPAATDMGGNW